MTTIACHERPTRRRDMRRVSWSGRGGRPVGADFTSGKWLWSDGSVDGITKTILAGVPEPKEHSGAMPSKGGVEMSDDHARAVAAYVGALGHQKK